LKAVALLGALTHQTLNVSWRAAKRTGAFFNDIRAVSGTS
jgi:hypothetical protein